VGGHRFSAQPAAGRSPTDNPYDESRVFSLRALADDKLIGIIEINRIMRQARHCMFWYAIGDADYRGRGYGSDALRVLLKFAFLEMNLNRVGLEVMSYNTAALTAYERIGFVREGVQREVVYRDGAYYDIIGMGMLRREWEARYWQADN
jgi:RimJ/RimL family protein N-acetyltransferase